MHRGYQAAYRGARLAGQYGDAAVIAQLVEAGVHLVTRGRTYQFLERPQLQRVLAHPPTASVTSMNTGELIELFEGGWLQLEEGLPQVRVIVARHRGAPGKPVRVGKRVGEWVYELFITTLPVEGFLVEDVLDLYHGRGAFEAVLAEEDVEEDPDRWCSYTECGQELWQIACQWVWNLRLSLGKVMQGAELRKIEWAPPKEATLLFLAWEPTPEEYGPWQLAGDVRRARSQMASEAFVWQEDGKLRCPAGASLWLSEVRQENAFTRASGLPGLPDRLPALCSTRTVSGTGGQRQPCSSCQCCSPPLAHAFLCGAKARCGGVDAALVDGAGRAIRRSWASHWRRPYVEVFAVVEAPKSASPPARPPRAIRSRHRWSWHDRLAHNAWWGPPQLRVTVAGVPACLAMD